MIPCDKGMFYFFMRSEKVRKLFLIAAFVALFGMIAGCTQYRLFKPMIDTSQWAKNGGKMTLAIMAVATGDKRIMRRGAYEYELAQKLARYIQADVFSKQTQYADLAPQYKLQIPADLKPAKMSFVDRERVEQILQEQDFGQTDQVDDNTAAKMGRKIAGAKAIMFITCGLQVSGKREQQLYDTKREVYYENEKNKKTGQMETVKKVRYIQVPRTAGGRNVIKVSQLVRVKCEVRMIEVATSKVLHAHVTQSQTFEVYAEIREGERAKLDIKAGAEESLKSLGHRIGRLFYPIVVAGGIFGGIPGDPRRQSDDPLGNDLTWN